MPSTAIAIPPALVPDREQIGLFVRTIFKNASPEGIVSLRAFGGDRGGLIYNRLFEIDTDDFKSLIGGAFYAARDAIKAEAVFSPPIATFKTRKNAAEFNLAEAFTISVECDERPREALATLSALIGAPTIVVASGGRWTNPEAGEFEDKLHLHWVLRTPARDPESFAKLKQARAYACAIVSADPSCIPCVHPMRWPGGWHMKDPNNPRLCHITGEIGDQIDLDKVFETLREIAPAEATVKKVRHAKDPVKPKNAFLNLASGSGPRIANFKTLAEAMKFVANPRLHWTYWNNVGMALFNSTGGSEGGFELFNNFSKLSEKYDPVETRARWEHYKTSPPDRIGAGTIYAMAVDHGWERSAPEVKPTQVVTTVSLQQARDELKRAVHFHFNYEWRQKNCFDIFAEEALGAPQVSVIAKPVEVGVGKTHEAIEAIAASDQRFLYCVPTIKVGGVSEEIKAKFLDRGVDVEIFRGRNAEDPNHPQFLAEPDDPEHENPKMCLDGKSVAEAVEAMQPVSTTCCKSGEFECPFFEACGYQKQMKKKPRVWIAASDVLFHRHRVFRRVQSIVIDESFFERSLRGISGGQVKLSLDDLAKSKIVQRLLLARHLLAQADYGGLQRATIEGPDPNDPALNDEFLHRLKIDEWVRYKEFSKQLEMLPGRGSRLNEGEQKKLIKEIVLSRHIITIIGEIQHMMNQDIETSGRLQIKSFDEKRYITWRGRAPVTKYFQQKPVLYLDATMPSEEILKAIFPEMEINTSRPVTVPHTVYTLQVRKAPTSATKLIHGEHVEGHRDDIRLCILRYWMACGCQPTVVIAQKPVADWLRDQQRQQKLPENIGIEHFNAVAGIDRHRNVRLQILIGRVQPGAEAIESQAATFTGEMPEVTISDDGNFDWYSTEPVELQLRNGKVKMMKVDRHPDPNCEMHRHLITEGELLQAYGRARPLNRDETSPLTSVLLFDNVVPGISVDDVVNWKAPSRFIETAYSDGMMLTSPADLRRVWPNVWESLRTAERDVAEGVPPLPGFVEVTYRPKTPKAKKRVAYLDAARYPDFSRALQDRLGVPVQITPMTGDPHPRLTL